MSTRILALAMLLAAAGCGGGKAPAGPPPRPNSAAPATATTAAAAAVKPAEPDFVYSSVGKRDPFRSYLAELAQENNAFTSRCSTPLGRFDIEQLKLVAVVTGLEDPVAMVEAPSGVGYTVRRGACIGKNGGLVASVRSGEVIVTEWAVRADGSRDQTQTALRLPKAALNLEE